MAEPQEVKPWYEQAWFRKTFVWAAGIAVAIGAFFVAKRYSLWVLVPLPSIIGLVYHVLSLSDRFDSRKSVVEAYRDFTTKFDQKWSGNPSPTKVSEDLADSMDRHAPTFVSMLWGAALLMAVFSVPAIVSGGGSTLDPIDAKLTSISAALEKAQTTVAAKTPDVNAIKAALTTAQTSVTQTRNTLQPWQVAVVFSGFGVWVLIVLRTIGRINAGGLNARFMITASLRAGAAMMLGFFVGAASANGTLFGAIPAGPTTYFLVGVFYPLFFEQLRDETFKLFKRNKSITNELPTNWVDGVDDDTQDILTEVNVLSVQHLATSDPGVLTVRSLFPFNRVVDLIDQAILISYFREDIVKLRKFGMRGAIDFVSAFEPVLRNGDDAAFTTLAEAMEIKKETLKITAVTICDDYRVNLLQQLWQHNAEGVRRAPESSAQPPVPRLWIRKNAEPSYIAVASDPIEGELVVEAFQRATQFRQQNPGAVRPTDMWLNDSFTEAWAAARLRVADSATQPGPRARQVYDQAFLGAIG